MRPNTLHTDIRKMKKLLITILIVLFCIPVFAQSAASIRKDNSYIYAEGTAATTGAADSVALDALTAKLAQGVELRSLPSPDAAAIAEAKSRRETILKGLNVEFDRQDIYDKGIVELTFTYNGTPVKNIDYKFFDGKTWSKILSAKDGKGFVEVRPDSRIGQYRIKYEITPAHLQHLFREVSLVEKALASEAKGETLSGHPGRLRHLHPPHPLRERQGVEFRQSYFLRTWERGLCEKRSDGLLVQG